MSAMGTLHLIPWSSVPDLTKAAGMDSASYCGALQNLTKEVATYSWSGYVLAALLPILRTNYSIDLLSSEPELAQQLSSATESTYVILTYADREASLARLDAASFNPGQLRAAFEAFNAMDAPEAEQFMPDGISFLRDGLRHLDTEHLLILIIG